MWQLLLGQPERIGQRMFDKTKIKGLYTQIIREGMGVGAQLGRAQRGSLGEKGEMRRSPKAINAGFGGSVCMRSDPPGAFVALPGTAAILR